MTDAVEAAAARAYENGARIGWPTWTDLPAIQKLSFREAVMPIVMAALKSLPDPRHGAWIEGLYCGLRQGYEDDNPYSKGGLT